MSRIPNPAVSPPTLWMVYPSLDYPIIPNRIIRISERGILSVGRTYGSSQLGVAWPRKGADMTTRTIGLAVVLHFAWVVGYAESFPVVGATYQLDRAQFPGKIAVCASEKAMVLYFTAKATKEDATARKMLFSADTRKEFEKLKANNGCTLISSFSQAKVVEKGTGAHRAEFAAFPLQPMWGVAVYFGRRVN
jgi:hypothetical protein